MKKMSENHALERMTTSAELENLLEENHAEISDRVATYFRREIGLTQRLFPGKMQRLINEHSLREAKTHLDFKLALLKLAVDAKLEAIREQYDLWLKGVKVHYRAQFSAFVTSREAELRRQIDQRRAEYLEYARERYQLAEDFKDIPTANHYRRSIEEEDARYFEWLDAILENFRGIIAERIKSYEQ